MTKQKENEFMNKVRGISAVTRIDISSATVGYSSFCAELCKGANVLMAMRAIDAVAGRYGLVCDFAEQFEPNDPICIAICE